MSRLRKSLLVVSMAGILFSALGLAATLLNRSHFEDAVRRIVAWQVEQEIERLFTPAPIDGGGALAAVRNRMVENAKLAERFLGTDYPERIAAGVAELCTCRLDIADREEGLRRFTQTRDRIAAGIREVVKGGLDQNRLGIETLNDLVGGYYIQTVDGLKRDLRIFFGSNLLLFAAVAAGVLWSSVGGAMVLPAFLLFIGTAISSGFYLFNQDWLASILFHDWTGFAYLGWVAFLTLLLCDVFLNRARVTLRLISSIGISPVGIC